MSTTLVKREPKPKTNDPWFGPHLQYDMIRLARKGWPTIARVVYLVALLVSLTVMWRTQGDAIHITRLAEFAQRAESYAYTLIIIQDLLVLVLLPVYVASAIAQEKENQTLEALTLTHLTDRELVLGKLGARLLHLGAVVLSGYPILAFLHLWGNVDISMLVYFETHTFCLLISAGGVCIWVSTRADSVFQAISGSYPWLAVIGFVSIVSALALPWIAGAILQIGSGPFGNLTPNYLWPLLAVVPAHGFLALIVVRDAIGRMEYLRRSERRKPRAATGAMGLSDTPKPASIPGARGQVRSRIHPLAWPIGEDALHWKECLKDGSSWSLNPRWLLKAVGVVAMAGLFFRLVIAITTMEETRRNLPGLLGVFAFTPYFIALAAYTLSVIFQMTLSVAGEREHGTLGTLLMVPSERREILWAKWLGPWVRNWPILAIAYLGALFGLACGIYGVLPALALLVLPWPVMIFAAGLALWLSVMCRRVLFANMALVGVLGILFIAHVAAAEQTRAVLGCFLALVGDVPWKDMASRLSLGEAALLAVSHQAAFLAVGGLCVLASFRSFSRRDFGSN